MNKNCKLKFSPAVFVVKEKYVIVCISEKKLLLGVEIDGQRFFDNSNGVIRCRKRVHKVEVPMQILDKSKKYTVFYREVKERKGDFTTSFEEEKYDFSFRPVNENKNINIYQISDAHQKTSYPNKSAKFFENNLDLLVINGDTFDYLNKENDVDFLFSLIEDITKGELPVVFAKGNHDNKGEFAEDLQDYTPTYNGKSYYTFRLGKIWGLVLDCGENCVDESEEYGHTVCHHQMRIDETEFIKQVIKDADKEYRAKGVEVKIIVSHCAITNVRSKPFDIEIDIYKEWVKLIKENIKPNFMMSGHLHITRFCLPNDELDSLGQTYPVIIGSNPVGWQVGKLTDFIGLALTIGKENVEVKFTNSNKQILEEHIFNLKDYSN